ncbi:MAG: endolytic transglycosylase MltG [Gammaproteobacteria bacterium]|nr:endolytic transglycosylase MltG [Gammaproteobacteria bacterium]MDP2141159.1 endolytic transglycosylase MltG [Gammaproteobacteria bacterium]MDP2349167.1 endolytic transglycosylase MltG [Gammaproteobacteria bacterium]
MISKLVRYSLLLISVLTLGAFVAYMEFELYLDTPLPLISTMLLDVRPGSSMNQVSTQLAEQASLGRPRLFSLWARYHGYDTGLRAGEYELAVGMTPRAALAHIMSGRSVQYPVTFIEGNTTRQTLEALWLSSKLTITLQGKSDDEILTALESPYTSIEGVLYPDTYFYTAGDTDLSILRRSAGLMEAILTEEWNNRAPDLPYATPYEALIMASIIEKESGLNSEREQIAGVFVRRLRTGMRLQSDPTVIYGIGSSYDGNIRRVDLDTTTPYNTYRINGLPPTPIALAGRNALHAALHPTDDTALYFVARGDGGHQFSNTLEEHNAAVRQYLLNRSSPASQTP